MILLTFRELQSISSQPGFRYCLSTGADLRPKLPDNCAVCFGWLLPAFGARFPGAATAALDTTSFWPHMGCIAGSGLWVSIHWGCGERLGSGEENHSQGPGGRWTSNLNGMPHTHNPGLQLPTSFSRCLFSSSSFSPCTPCCPWACGMLLLRESSHPSHTCWSLDCTLDGSLSHRGICYHR